MGFKKLLLLSLFAGGLPLNCLASNYFPGNTTPQWEESSITVSEFIGATSTQSKNLRGTDGALVIINGFEGNTYIRGISLTEDLLGFGFPRVDSYTDFSLTEEGLMQYGSISTTYSTVHGQRTDARMSSTSSITWGRNGTVTTPGVLVLRRQAKIGDVYVHEYVSHDETTIGTKALEQILDLGYSGETQQIQKQTLNVRVRSVFAGFQPVDNLYPGANPARITPSYLALVRIVETESWGTITTETTGGQFPGTVTDDFGPTSATTVSWLVDGIGQVKMALVLGDYLDDILNAPIFDKGDGVVAAQTLLETVGGSYDMELLRESGGNILDAKDAQAVNGVVQLLGDYSIPPAPLPPRWWSPGMEVGGDWFQIEALGGYIYIPESMQQNNGTLGWVVHAELGDLYMAGDTLDSLWIYHPVLGWSWTAGGTYPHFYLSAVSQWTSFAYGNNQRYFYSYPQQKWFSEEEIKGSGVGVLGQ